MQIFRVFTLSFLLCSVHNLSLISGKHFWRFFICTPGTSITEPFPQENQEEESQLLLSFKLRSNLASKQKRNLKKNT